MNISGLLDLIQYLFLIYLGFTIIYLLFFAIASFFYKNNNEITDGKLRNFLILIPAFKEDKIILNTATEALKQDYPSDLFDVYVIADSFKPETIEILKKEEGVNVLEVSFEHSTKSRSINKALEVIPKDYDGIVILDADNLMGADFIQKVNRAMSNGATSIQSHRVAKNLNTSFAILDAISEEVNNTMFRQGPAAVGISSGLIGSGMAFEYKLFK
jgi:cellulose synthase/poly-beta-1,6-N-acetylglucosamine synthase-like glycosyltransferase